MSKKSKKIYVVWQGHQPGVYSEWTDCLKQITGFSSPVFKAFSRNEIAQKAFADNPERYLHQDYEEPPMLFDKQAFTNIPKPINDAMTVDAACSGNPGIMEYRGVDFATGKEIFKKGPFELGTNNIGEFLAIVHALALMEKQGDTRPIYSDSLTAIQWIKGKQARTNLVKNEKTEELFQIIERAEKWLKTHQQRNPILKWETDIWGEIPADFGRK